MVEEARSREELFLDYVEGAFGGNKDDLDKMREMLKEDASIVNAKDEYGNDALVYAYRPLFVRLYSNNTEPKDGLHDHILQCDFEWACEAEYEQFGNRFGDNYNLKLNLLKELTDAGFEPSVDSDLKKYVKPVAEMVLYSAEMTGGKEDKKFAKEFLGKIYSREMSGVEAKVAVKECVKETRSLIKENIERTKRWKKEIEANKENNQVCNDSYDDDRIPF